jgi:Fur family transcriptional regulator, zinc uptake regulator
MSFSHAHDHNACTTRLVARAEQICADRGSKLTAQRRDVLQCLGQSHAAVGAYDIIERMAALGPRPAPITIYRALDFLLAHDLVHKVESKNAFIACAGAHDTPAVALMICESCDIVTEGEQSRLAKDLKQMADSEGFLVRRAVIEVSGLCASCADKAPNA